LREQPQSQRMLLAFPALVRQRIFTVVIDAEDLIHEARQITGPRNRPPYQALGHKSRDFLGKRKIEQDLGTHTAELLARHVVLEGHIQRGGIEDVLRVSVADDAAVGPRTEPRDRDIAMPFGLRYAV